jgi:hypothetical protein
VLSFEPGAQFEQRNQPERSSFVPGTPAALFQTHIVQFPIRQQYDVARDGRFLINTELQDASIEPIHLLLNWKPLTSC